MYLESIYQKLIQILGAESLHFVPCTNSEIDFLEKTIKFPLPKAYKEYLLLMGNQTSPLFVGTNRHYKDLIDLQKGARDLLVENQFPKKLPDNAFVIAMHQGYQFWFFYINEGDNDPIIYGYNEGETQSEFNVLFPSFSDYLDDHVNYISGQPKHIKLWEKFHSNTK